MRKKLLIIVLGAAVVMSTALRVYAQGPQGQRGVTPPPPPMMTKQVKPGLFMVINGGGNSIFRITNDGLILVDTKNIGGQFYDELVAQIKTITSQPVKYVFVTHVHQDH